MLREGGRVGAGAVVLELMSCIVVTCGETVFVAFASEPMTEEPVDVNIDFNSPSDSI